MMPIAIISFVKETRSIVMLAALLDDRIRNGRCASALYSLRAIGMPDSVINEVIENWPAPDRRALPHTVVSYPEECACFFACFINNPSMYDWPRLLNQAIRASAAVEKRIAERNAAGG